MVFGGSACGGHKDGQERGDPKDDEETAVTLLSLDGDPPVPECLTNLNPFPTPWYDAIYDACGASLTDGRRLGSKKIFESFLSHAISSSNRQDPTYLWGRLLRSMLPL